jgi:hypothetical protein
LRFLLKSRETKRFVVDISSNISEWPQPSYLFVSLTDRSSGQYLESAPVELMFYQYALHLAGTVRVSTDTIRIVPNKSIGAQLTAAQHVRDLDKPISEFFPRQRPIFSKCLKLRG